MKYIGITGHRGSGKTTIAYLLGNILDGLRWNYDKDKLQLLYNRCCKLIKENNNAIYDCGLMYVYFDEFGEMPKYLVAQLLGIDMSVLDNDVMKDTMYVNMKDFKLYPYNESFKLITITDILSNSSKKWKDSYISLRDFAKCFSIDIMQKLFGSDVWLKTRIANDEKWQDNDSCVWKIFSDVKTKEEIKYIKDNNGVVIRCQRPTKKKNNNGISNTENCDVDYVIITEGDLKELFTEIYNIAINIYEKSINNSI